MRKLAFVHVPNAGNAVSLERWRARGVLLRMLGWRGTVGLCPAPCGDRQSSPLLTTERGPVLEALEALGCERAHGTRGLALDTMDPVESALNATARDVKAGDSLGKLFEAFRAQGQFAHLQMRVRTILRRAQERSEHLRAHETFFIASEHAWLLLALAREACSFPPDGARLLRLSIDEFPGVFVVHEGGYWGGFIELSPNKPESWYLL